MKKIIFALAMSIVFVACNKKDEAPQPSQSNNVSESINAKILGVEKAEKIEVSKVNTWIYKMYVTFITDKGDSLTLPVCIEYTDYTQSGFVKIDASKGDNAKKNHLLLSKTGLMDKKDTKVIIYQKEDIDGIREIVPVL